MNSNDSVALLSNKGEYTLFSYGDTTITFLTGKHLERYTAVKEWDNGYIVVMAKDVGKPELKIILIFCRYWKTYICHRNLF